MDPKALLQNEAKLMQPREVRSLNYMETRVKAHTIGVLVYEVVDAYKDNPGIAEDYLRWAIAIDGEPYGGGVVQ